LEEVDQEWEDERMRQGLKAAGEQIVNAAERAGKPLPDVREPEEAREYVESLDPEELADQILAKRAAGTAGAEEDE
jgi:hypothetical protein